MLLGSFNEIQRASKDDPLASLIKDAVSEPIYIHIYIYVLAVSRGFGGWVEVREACGKKFHHSRPDSS